MAILRYQGKGMRSLFDELEELVSSGFDLAGREFSRMYPNIDIVEVENGYRIHADLPGMKKEEIRIDIDRDILTISGERTHPDQKTEREYYSHLERGYGKFARSFNLPSNVDSTNIEAHYTNGVLEIYLHKTKQTKPKSVEIKVQ